MAQQDKTAVNRQSNNKCVVRTGQTPVDGHVVRAYRSHYEKVCDVLKWATDQTDDKLKKLIDLADRLNEGR